MDKLPSDMIWRNQFKARFKHIYENSGMNLSSLSDNLNISIDDTRLLMDLQDCHIPNEAIILKICQLFGITVSWLFTEDD